MFAGFVRVLLAVGDASSATVPSTMPVAWLFRVAGPAGAVLAFDVALLALTIRGVFGRADRVVLFRVFVPDFPPTSTFLI